MDENNPQDESLASLFFGACNTSGASSDKMLGAIEEILFNILVQSKDPLTEIQAVNVLEGIQCGVLNSFFTFRKNQTKKNLS